MSFRRLASENALLPPSCQHQAAGASVQPSSSTRLTREAGGRMCVRGCLLLLISLLVGCAIAPERNAVPLSLVDKATVPGLTAVRSWGDQVPRDIANTLKARLPNMGLFAEAAVRENGHPIVNVLALSGGGSDGAFGAGVLTGCG